MKQFFHRKNQNEQKQLLQFEEYECILQEFNRKIPKTIQYCRQCLDSQKLTRKIYGYGVKSFKTEANANLRSLAYVFIVMCFKNEPNMALRQGIFREITKNVNKYKYLKNMPYSFQGQQLGNLTFILWKELLSQKHIYELLDRYFGLVELLVLFFRVLLVDLKFPEGEDYTSSLQTKEIYAILAEYFDVKYEHKKPFYLFQNHGLFICFQGKYCVGRYSTYKAKLFESEESPRKNILNLDEFGNFSFKFNTAQLKQKNTQINCESQRSIDCMEMKEAKTTEVTPKNHRPCRKLDNALYFDQFVGTTPRKSQNPPERKQKNMVLSYFQNNRQTIKKSTFKLKTLPLQPKKSKISFSPNIYQINLKPTPKKLQLQRQISSFKYVPRSHNKKSIVRQPYTKPKANIKICQ